MWTAGNLVKASHQYRKSYASFFAMTFAMSLAGLALLCIPKQSAMAASNVSARKTAQNITATPATGLRPQRIVANQPDQFTQPSLRLAAPGDRCDGKLGGDPIWLIGGWIIGNEIYKSYQDPSINCPGAYPFTIDTVHIFLNFAPDPADTSVHLPLNIPISVDIESVDTTSSPGCPVPGAVLFSGSPGSVQIPTANFFDIAIPLDAPFEVNGPYFVGLTFNDTIPFQWGVELVTDDIEALCVSYNNWDSTIGFVDMGNDTLIHQNAFPNTDPCFSAPANDSGCFDFDGRLLLWSNGITGGTPPVALPGIAILGPEQGDRLFGSTDIWVSETTGSPAIDSAVFSQRTDVGAWVRIGVDANQDIGFGRGVISGAGQGLSYLWDFSAETEGTHWIKVSIYDSLAQTATDSVSVFLEPTPPVPAMTTPAYFSRFCDTVTLTYDIIDENPSSMLVLKKPADMQFSQGLETQNQFALGDVDGDTADGNPASQGEFGDFYGGPAVGALALRYWHDQGFIQSLRVGSATLTNAQAAERLATMFMKVRINGSLSDENFVLGFREYLLVTGFGELKLEYNRQASYPTLRNWTEDLGVCAMVRIGGSSGGAGNWFAVDGYDGLPTSENVYRVRVSDPSDGTIKTLFWRDGSGGAEMFYQGAWFPVDIIAALLPTNWSATGRANTGLFDFAVGSQATFLLDSTAANLTDGSLYFITAQLTDQNSNLGELTTLLELNCASFAIGDYDGNGVSNIGDVVYLISFQLQGGPPPVGGAIRADVNCDGTIDTGDLVFYINWVFVGGPAPCR